MPAQFQIDADIQVCLDLRPGQVPGVRTVAGRPLTYDADLRLSFLAREAVRSAPALMAALSDEQLDALHSACMTRHFDTQGREPATEALFKRVADERAARRNAIAASMATLAPVFAMLAGARV